MQFLRTNTAQRVTVGPFLDPVDGVTPEVALTTTACKLTMTADVANVPTLVIDANATASGGNNDLVHITGDDAGLYDLELTAAQTNSLGRARLIITDAVNHCPVEEQFMILPANIYDAFVLGTDKIDVKLAAAERTAVADALFDEVGGVEANLTFRQHLRLAAAALFGKASGLAGTNPKYRDYNDTKDRLDATVDAYGNRTNVTRDAT
jgi:hypothetical protein